jgi:hypothetical protein
MIEMYGRSARAHIEVAVPLLTQSVDYLSQKHGSPVIRPVRGPIAKIESDTDIAVQNEQKQASDDNPVQMG